MNAAELVNELGETMRNLGRTVDITDDHDDPLYGVELVAVRSVPDNDRPIMHAIATRDIINDGEWEFQGLTMYRTPSGDGYQHTTNPVEARALVAKHA